MCARLPADLAGGPGTETTSPPAPSTTTPDDTYTDEYGSAWCYQRLDYRLQSDYRALYQAVRESDGRDETVVISDSETGEEHSYTGLKIDLPQPIHTREEAQELFNAFTRDNPQFFSSPISIATRGTAPAARIITTLSVWYTA